MEKFENIKKVLEKIRNSSELSLLAEDKRIPVLLHIIQPTLGKIVDALIIGSVREKNLADKFQLIEDELDTKISVFDGAQLLDLIADNREVLYTTIARLDSVMSNQEDLAKLISAFFVTPKDQYKEFKPSESFKFVVIAGASGTGKDVQLELLHKHQFKNFRHNDILTKLTTREPRNHDSDYYKFIAKSKFLKKVGNGEILFPYNKRDYQYGFNKEQFVNGATGSNLLFSIFTEFEMAETAKAFLDELGVNSQFILFNASEKVLLRRVKQRNFRDAEVKRRVISIEKDLQFIDQNRELLESIYNFVEVGDDMSVEEIQRILVDLIDR